MSNAVATIADAMTPAQVDAALDRFTGAAKAKTGTKTKAAKTSKPQPSRQPVRQAITFEAVQARAPHAALAANLSRTFAIDPVDYAAIMEGTEEQIVRCANLLVDDLTEKASEMHLQRIVGAFVGSAFGAANFYGSKVTQAKDLTMKSQNDDRDEDRSGVSGFDSRAEQARYFAAQMGLQAFALMAAAEGALSAYEQITGSVWKPYEAATAPAGTVSRQSAAAELAAFG